MENSKMTSGDTYNVAPGKMENCAVGENAKVENNFNFIIPESQFNQEQINALKSLANEYISNQNNNTSGNKDSNKSFQCIVDSKEKYDKIQSVINTHVNQVQVILSESNYTTDNSFIFQFSKEYLNKLENNSNVQLCKKDKDGTLKDISCFIEKSKMMPKSIYHSLDKPRKKSINDIKEFVQGDLAKGNLNAKDQFKVFLSARTRKPNSAEYSLEYNVARKLKEELERDGIGVFWWEDENLIKQGWNKSTKIAMGLGFSTIFIGLAFDSIFKDSSNQYCYDCLLNPTKEDGSPNFFKYEIEKFYSLSKNKNSLKRQVKKIIDKKDLSKLVPASDERKLFLYTMAPEKPSGTIFDGDRDGHIEWNQIKEEDANDVDSIVSYIIDQILSTEDIDQNDSIGELWKPFEPSKSLESQEPTNYMDSFLFPTLEEKEKFSNSSYQEKEKIEKKYVSINEDFYALPREFEFKYVIIDEHGRNAKNHLLIFPDKEYIDPAKNDRCNVRWNLNLVVRDWTLKRDNLSGDFPFSDGILNKYDKLRVDKEGVQTQANYQSSGMKINLKNINFLDYKKNQTTNYKFEICFSKTSATTYSIEECKFTAFVVFYPKHSRLRYKGRFSFDKPLKLLYKQKRCPYCGIEHPLNDYCTINPLLNFYTRTENSDVKYSNPNFLDNSGAVKYYSWIKGESNQFNPKINLPSDIQDSRTMVVSIIGASQSGKSTFISRLFNVMDSASDCDSETNPHSNYLQHSLQPFISNIELVVDGEVGKISKDLLTSKYKLYSNKTDNGGREADMQTRVPFQFIATSSFDSTKNYISFFDVPGGYIYKEGNYPFIDGDTNNYYLMASQSDCIVLVLVIDKNGEVALDTTSCILSKMEEKYEEQMTKSRPILAIILCKSDQFCHKEGYEKIAEIIRTVPPVCTETKFRNSSRHNYILKNSYEIKQFLKSKNNNDLPHIFTKYEREGKCCYFAISALGRSDTIFNDQNAIFKANPTNIENLMLWIMYKKGLIR